MFPIFLAILKLCTDQRLFYVLAQLIVTTNARCRCGMVYYDVGDLGWRPYVKSWMQRVGQKYKEETRVRILLFVSCECPEGYLVTPLKGGLLMIWGLGYQDG